MPALVWLRLAGITPELAGWLRGLGLHRRSTLSAGNSRPLIFQGLVRSSAPGRGKPLGIKRLRFGRRAAPFAKAQNFDYADAAVERGGQHVAAFHGGRRLDHTLTVHPDAAGLDELCRKAARFDDARIPQPLIEALVSGCAQTVSSCFCFSSCSLSRLSAAKGESGSTAAEDLLGAAVAANGFLS